MPKIKRIVLSKSVRGHYIESSGGILLKLFLLLVPLTATALITEPIVKTNRKLESQDLRYIGDLLHRGRLSDEMDCEIKVKEVQEVRKFKEGSRWTESLEVDYRAYKYDDGQRAKVILTVGQSYGIRKSHHLTKGSIEEFRIELDDRKNSFIEFSHDGKGELVGFLFGDIDRIYPCRIKR